jgi:hypothetical protein
MPVKLSTTINKVDTITNHKNSVLIKQFYEYMKNNGASEKHINNNLKAIMNLLSYIDARTSFLNIQRKEQII